MRGRKPLPTRLKLIKGNPGRRPVNTREPVFAAEPPTCPDHLDDVAREEWERVSGELARRHLLTTVDRAALAAYCQSYSTWVEAQRQVVRTGMIVIVNQKWSDATRRLEGGTPAVNPYFTLIDKSLSQMRAFLVEFGLTPSSRSRLAVPKAPKDNPFLKLQRKK